MLFNLIAVLGSVGASVIGGMMISQSLRPLRSHIRLCTFI